GGPQHRPQHRRPCRLRRHGGSRARDARARRRVIVTTAAEMRRMDALTIERFGVPGATLMERAGVGAATLLLERFPHVRKHGVVVLAGKGNNGGDGFVVARALKKKRVRVDVILAVSASDIRGDARTKLQAWQRTGGKVQTVTPE